MYIFVQVTGSGRGIGREIAINLAKTGATIVCWSKSAEPNKAVANEIKKKGGIAHSYTVDVADRTQVQQAASLVNIINSEFYIIFSTSL